MSTPSWNQEEQSELRGRLRDAAGALRELLADATGLTGTVTLDQAAVGRISRADAMQQQEVSKAALRRAAARLERVEAALERFDDDPEDYPWCPDCGEHIGLGRLQAVPESVFCVSCLEARQRKR